MARIGAIRIGTKEVMQNVTLSVRISKALKIRVWLASQVFRFGAFVLGANCEISTNMGNDD